MAGAATYIAWLSIPIIDGKELLDALYEKLNESSSLGESGALLFSSKSIGRGQLNSGRLSVTRVTSTSLAISESSKPPSPEHETVSTRVGRVVSELSDSGLRIRCAVPDDAAAIVSVLATIAAERIHSAIDRAWTVEQERRYLELLSPREVIHVAVNDRSEILGLQILDRWSSLESMAHVGQIGTFMLPDWRGQGVGRLGQCDRSSGLWRSG